MDGDDIISVFFPEIENKKKGQKGLPDATR